MRKPLRIAAAACALLGAAIASFSATRGDGAGVAAGMAATWGAAFLFHLARDRR